MTTRVGEHGDHLVSQPRNPQATSAPCDRLLLGLTQSVGRAWKCDFFKGLIGSALTLRSIAQIRKQSKVSV
jgi:hypothetical protein